MFGDLWRAASHAPTEPERAAARAAFGSRFVSAAFIALVPLFGFALGVPPKRSTSALGVFLSIVMLVTQHKINEYGEALGALGRVDPLISLWVPFVLFAALTFWMYHTIANVPGGQPIGALERWAAKAGKALRRWLMWPCARLWAARPCLSRRRHRHQRNLCQRSPPDDRAGSQNIGV